MPGQLRRTQSAPLPKSNFEQDEVGGSGTPSPEPSNSQELENVGPVEETSPTPTLDLVGNDQQSEPIDEGAPSQDEDPGQWLDVKDNYGKLIGLRNSKTGEFVRGFIDGYGAFVEVTDEFLKKEEEEKREREEKEVRTGWANQVRYLLRIEKGAMDPSEFHTEMDEWGTKQGKGLFPGFEALKSELSGVYESTALDKVVFESHATRYFARQLQTQVRDDLPRKDVDALLAKMLGTDALQPKDVIKAGLDYQFIEEHEDGSIGLPTGPGQREQALLRGQMHDELIPNEDRHQKAQSKGWRLNKMTWEGSMQDTGQNAKKLTDTQMEQGRLTPNNGVFEKPEGEPGEAFPDLNFDDMTDGEVINTSPKWALNEVERVIRDEGLSRKEARKKVAGQLRAEPRYIFVMDSKGTFHVTRGEYGKVHHSSMDRGKGDNEGVAAAGELLLVGGVPKLLSDQSGHYMLDPAETWQAVKQLEIDGFDVSGLEVHLFALGNRRITGRWFLDNFDPTLPEEHENHLRTGPDGTKDVQTKVNTLVNDQLGVEKDEVVEEESGESDDEKGFDILSSSEEEESEEGTSKKKKKKKKNLLSRLSGFARKVFTKKKGKKK